jgi:thioredoxin-like negative regulator of GroEL
MTGAVDLSALKQRAASGGDGAPRPGQHSVEITEANFEAEVLVRSSEVPVVVLLWSPRSQACVTLLDGLDALATADAGKWSLATVNVDASPRVGAMFGVEAVPTVVALAGGQPLASFEGPQPPEQLRRWIDSLLSATAGKLAGEGDGEGEPAVDPALTAARSYWVKVTNVANTTGANSTTANITINQPAAITTQPATTTPINSGSTATLSVVATGTTPLALRLIASVFISVYLLKSEPRFCSRFAITSFTAGIPTSPP